MIIKVDQSVCVGHGVCAIKAPKLYELDDEGFSIANGTVVPAGQDENARRGAAVCPERAIALVDNGNG
ncbi:ferredoxin [Sphingobium sp. SCG-1]|uniref:ferredoxin n=1 Tax=Sphingobium sp. SCG-1 TaxID=2072936 RepID=UPI000CD6A0C4|nr:ferredoxin [Sphingobium sp. SCG-1]AUW59666.1 ferredoxin [Sphingobium sp. SCG-1]